MANHLYNILDIWMNSIYLLHKKKQFSEILQLWSDSNVEWLHPMMLNNFQVTNLINILNASYFFHFIFFGTFFFVECPSALNFLPSRFRCSFLLFAFCYITIYLLCYFFFWLTLDFRAVQHNTILCVSILWSCDSS